MISDKIIKTLAKKSKAPGLKVSIYIPTHQRSDSASLHEDQTRYKNAIQKIQAALEKKEAEGKDILKQLKKLENNSEFWRHQDKSVGIFVSQSGIHTIKLPIEVTERAELHDAYILHPLIFAKNMQINCLLFDVNLEKPRMFRLDSSDITEVSDLDFVSMKDMMEEDYEQHTQFYTPQGSRGAAPMFHGHGGSDDHANEEVVLYLQYLARKVNAFLAKEKLPLLLAGEKNRLSQIEPLLHYKRIESLRLHGNHQHASPHDLHDTLRERLIDASQKETQQALSVLNGSPKTLKGWGAIAKAIKKGAVARLFVPTLRKTTDSVRSGKQQEYLLESELEEKSSEKWIIATLEQGGEIQAVARDGKQQLPLAELRF